MSLAEKDNRFSKASLKPNRKYKVKVDDEQFTLQGNVQGTKELEEMRAKLIAQTPNPNAWCPFCLKPQRLRTMRQWGIKGDLLRDVKCNHCHRGMEYDSALITQNPEDFGSWAASYKFFWKTVDHDFFVKEIHRLGWAIRFWAGYRKVNPNVGKSKEQVESEAYGAKYKEYLEDAAAGYGADSK